MSSGKQIDMLENMYVRSYLNPRGDSIHVDVHAIQCPSAYLQHARYRVTACPLLIQHTRRTFVATMSAHTSSVTVPSSCAEHVCMYVINHEPKLVSYRIAALHSPRSTSTDCSVPPPDEPTVRGCHTIRQL